MRIRLAVTVDATPTASAGQVGPAATAPKVSFYAASRFAEQASFGPTPALVAELQAKGFEQWIDEQLALPPSRLDPARVAENAAGTVPEKNAYVRAQFGTYAMVAPDQLRLRVTWGLSQFLVVRGTNTGMVTWFNLLQDHAFGNYAALLKALSLDPTMGDYLDNAVPLPPFLLAHPEQVAVQQGWLTTPDNDSSGWAGRALEALPSELRHARAGLTTTAQRTLVLGRRTPPSRLAQGTAYWGNGSLLDPSGLRARNLLQLANGQFAQAYQADYVRHLHRALDDGAALARVFDQTKPPQGDFGSDDLSRQLRDVAASLPVFKATGSRRQVFLVTWGAFDAHAEQRGGGPGSQDTQLPPVARALAAFDSANVAAGMDDSVATLVISDFGRTLRPSSGGGSEHAWGNHVMLMGGPIVGGTVHGVFPTLTLGGPDDGDPDPGGRFVPTTSTDQVAASLMQWLGLPPSQLHDVFPSLMNFAQKTMPLLRA